MASAMSELLGDRVRGCAVAAPRAGRTLPQRDWVVFEAGHPLPNEASVAAASHALETARRMLDTYEPPALDPAIDEALLAFIREREAVLPDSMA